MGPFALVLVVVLVCLLWSSLRIALSISQSQSSDKYPFNESATKSPSPRSVRLVQVHPPQGKEIETDIDIIAVHGLDTRSPDTWIWKSKTGDVNWLADNSMLPSRVGSARIFTCDWPANLFEHAAYSQKMFDESARLLLAGIEAQLRRSAPAKNQARPILFVASCLGGIILMKALVMARSHHNYVKTSVRGIVFLATPFRGTSFRDVAALAEPGLRLWAFLRNERVSKLVQEVMPSRELEDLVGDFTTICRVDGYVECMVTFYETGMSSLPRKIFPWLPDFLSQKRPIVEESSGTLEIIRDRRLPLSRTHVQMNKFPGPNDGDYGVVVGQIERILEKIREDRYHERADSHIKNQHYTTQMLEIERISTKRVSVETCYINLAIIEQPAEGGPQPSEVSLHRQLKITSRKGDGHIEIADLFDKHKNGENLGPSPRKILIRGQAGVGKSTLCKKLVHDFKEHGLWNALFDRILWIPLRNLKTLANRDCNLEGMFHQEYFSQLDDGELVAKEFWKYLKASKYEKTLFILDGLDEVYKESGDGSMFKLLRSLLEMPALIVTSRPQISLPVQKFELELETIGFYTDQIDSYVKAVFAGKPDKVKRLHSVLQQHKLFRDLVRIPIQLDALCYIWDTDESSVSIGSQLQTMTGVYQAIAGSLWTKDILALGKKNNNGDIIEKGELQNLPLRRIENFVPDEVCLLEGLAFTGMVYDMINFTRANSMETFDRFSHMNSQFSPDSVLQRTSFLRTSNPSADSPVYHFLHLTFQEYFAARYFVRQWQAQKPLILKSDEGSESVECFLKLHKYHARYDIFWRFVAGLLSVNDQEFTLGFFRLIGQEPLDLIGPVHQRLLMHCLSEVPGEATEGAFTTERENLEEKFSDWLAFEVKFTRDTKLVREMEFPDAPLKSVLQSASMDDRLTLSISLKYRPIMSIEAIHIVCSWLSDDVQPAISPLKFAILSLLGRQQGTLDDNALSAIIARLEDDDNRVQDAALFTLTKLPALEARVLDAVEIQAMDSKKDVSVRCKAIVLLGKQPRLNGQFTNVLLDELQGDNAKIKKACIEALAHHLDDDVLQSITTQLNNTDKYVRRAALQVLRRYSQRSDHVFQKIIALLGGSEEVFSRQDIVEFLGVWSQPEDVIFNVIKTQLDHDNKHVRTEVLEALEKWFQLSDKILNIVAVQLEHKDCIVRSQAIKTLGSQPELGHETLYAIKIRARLDHEMALEEAIRVLVNHSQVDDDTRDIIIARLHDEHVWNRCAVLDALNKWPQPDDEVIDLVVAHLKDDQWNVSVQSAALRALGAWPQLDDTVLCTIADKLGSRDNDVQYYAARALMKRPQPKGNVMKAIARRLIATRRISARAMLVLLAVLRNCPELDSDILCAIAGVLGVRTYGDLAKFSTSMFSISMFFQSRPQPANSVIKAIMMHREHDRSSNRMAALRAVGTWTRLATDTLLAIATHLEDPDSDVQEAAFRVLINQESPPFVVLEQHIPSLYRISLRISFQEHVYWITENGKPCIVVGSRKVDWNDKAEERDSRSGSDSSLGLQLRERAPEWLRDFGLGKRES